MQDRSRRGKPQHGFLRSIKGRFVKASCLQCHAIDTKSEQPYPKQYIDDESGQDMMLATTNPAIGALRESIASTVLTTSEPLQTFRSPFHIPNSSTNIQVPLVYCDQTASNRPVQSIEQYMQNICLPLYGNTHTITSVTGNQSTAFVSEARKIVAKSTNAKEGKDIVLFAGSGTTASVDLLIDCLDLKNACQDRNMRPVVFIGPYEHHSNLLPWRESGCEVVRVPECKKRRTVDLHELERLLSNPQFNNRIKIGTFSAASNVTGKVSDVDAIAALLHQHQALAFFDYATGAPYMKMDMNPSPVAGTDCPDASLVAKDAIFFSPHKMLGGIGTPGVLVVKKDLVNRVKAPSRTGGGTVQYVTNTTHQYLTDPVERYEGGTPNITGIMRVGLTFLLKRAAENQYAELQGTDNSLPNSLLDIEHNTYEYVRDRLGKSAPNLVLLGCGPSDDKNLPIFPFLIRCGKRFLHYNFVCAILNDVFGIQSRGGCQCAGPNSQRLLGLSDDDDMPNERNRKIEYALTKYSEGAGLLRPGYTRLSLPFKGMRNEEVEYVMKALEWVSKNGWALMCQYRCDAATGQWKHHSGQTESRELSRFDPLTTGDFSMKKNSGEEEESVAMVLDRAFANADLILEEARKDKRSMRKAYKARRSSSGLSQGDGLVEELRWYVRPEECGEWLRDGVMTPPNTESDEILGALNPQQ